MALLLCSAISGILSMFEYTLNYFFGYFLLPVQLIIMLVCVKLCFIKVMDYMNAVELQAKGEYKQDESEVVGSELPSTLKTVKKDAIFEASGQLGGEIKD